jgi:Mn-dependent DtxR family transcriptional regulator
MSLDTAPSRLRDIAERMGVAPDYASQYRARLIAAGVVEPVSYGTVTFAIPLLRNYLRRQARQGRPAGPS